MNSFFEINIMCIILLLMILTQSIFETTKRKSLRLFNCLTLAIMVSIISDFIFYLQQGHIYTMAIVISYVLNSLYFISILLAAYYCIRYIMCIMFDISNISKRVNALLISPLLIIFLLVISNGMHHLIFTIDPNNIYVRGPLFAICAIMVSSYLLLSLAMCLYNYYKSILKDQRINDGYMMFCISLPVIGAVIQFNYYGVNSATPSIVLALLMVYINNIKNEVNVDALTRLNNRGQFDKYLQAKFNESNSSAYLIMFDIDHFKDINDNYGHVEGDRALKYVAHILKEIFDGSQCFLARYGGDEFAVIIDCNEIALKELIHRAEVKMASKYSISISNGYCIIDHNQFVNCEDVIKCADDKMYQNKQLKKISHQE